MELINHTSYPALMFKAGLPEDRLAVSVAVRVAFDINKGKATVSGNQSWPLYEAPWESEYGPMETDNIFKKKDVDIQVFGKAHTAKNAMVRQMQVSVGIKNKLAYSLEVFGDRVWEKGFFGMQMSTPSPFSEMPLTLYNAYGGNINWDGLKMPYGNNPYGKGYYLNKEDAVNNALPNIEDPTKLIRSWNDRPDPVGITCCPLNELRMRTNLEFDSSGTITKFDAGLYNTSFPGMRVKDIKAGEQIEISGMTANGQWSFEMPDLPISTRIMLGEKIIERHLAIDQVDIIPDKNQVFLTYRYPFTYDFVPMQKRICEILTGK